MNVRSWKSDFRSDVGFFKEQKFPLWVETEKKKKETMKKDQNRKKEKSTLWPKLLRADQANRDGGAFNFRGEIYDAVGEN